jgi:putative SOS response-associated peptidase YedK
MVPVIIANSARRVVCMRWGLIPHWAKDEETAYNDDQCPRRDAYLTAGVPGPLSHNRALVPACGYYEWKAEGRDKTPYYIYPISESFMAFAGLYDVWQRPDGEDVYTFTIITTNADEYMAKLHTCMPIILARELEDAWLDPQLSKAQDVLDVLSRSTGLELDAYPVSRMVNRPSIDSRA